MSPGLFIAALTVVGALGALIFGALRFNREDAKSVVDQQSTLLTNQQSMNDQIQRELDRCMARRAELEERQRVLEEEHRNCDLEITRLRRELTAVQAKLARLTGGKP